MQKNINPVFSRGRFGLAAAMLVAALAFSASAGESHVASVVSEVMANVAKVKAECPDAVPMAFWDFDGTIIKGDVSEGLYEGGVQRYRGLVEETALAGLCTVYRGAEGWRQYRDVDYPRMNAIGRWLAWPYNAQMYLGQKADELDAFCTGRFAAVYRGWYFSSSVEILKALEAAGVENYIVSASPEAFVRNAAETLGLSRSRFCGVRVEVDAGRITSRLVHPAPMGEGKVENVRRLVLARPNGVAVAGFGNSYSTDGHFLRYVVTQRLPGGAKGFALMINGGEEKPGFKGLFTLVSQSETVNDAAAKTR